MRAVFLCVAAVALAAPASANAAKLSVAGGTLTYIGDPGLRTAISFELVDPAAPTTVRVVRLELAVLPTRQRQRSDHRGRLLAGRDLQPRRSRTCAPAWRASSPRPATCATRSRSPTSPARSACPAARATTRSAAAPGSDALNGDEGADYVSGGAGHDVLARRRRRRLARRRARRSDRLAAAPASTAPSTPRPSTARRVAITLDGVADDGAAGRARRLRRRYRGRQTSTAPSPGRGFDSPSRDPDDHARRHRAGRTELTTDAGDDTLSGGAGNDLLNSTLEGNDTIDARDGYADRVSCGPGTDTVLADTLDTFSRLRERRGRRPIAQRHRGRARRRSPGRTRPPTKALRRQRRSTCSRPPPPTITASPPCASSTTTGVVCEDTTAPYTLRLPGARPGRRAQHAHARRRRRRRPDREHAARRRPSAASGRGSRSPSTLAATAGSASAGASSGPRRCASARRPARAP